MKENAYIPYEFVITGSGNYTGTISGKFIIKKKPITPDIFLIFATFFGGVGGLNNIAAAIAPAIGVQYDGKGVGYCWIVCGIFLLGILPACLDQAWVTFILYALAGLALVLLGLIIIGVLPGSLSAIVGWMLFIVGVLGLYMTFSAMFGFVGKNLPMGPPVKKN